jgi:BirA family biotin operon repressor/biotin-[acetyl-CoA-carboxylase] ligase
LIESRKVAGILIETSHDERGQMVAVVGMGINANGHIEDVAQVDTESASFIEHATTLETALGHTVSREALIARLLEAFEQTYLALQQQTSSPGIYHTSDSSSEGELPPSRRIWERWRDHLSTLGRTIHVRQGDKLLSGIAEDVDGTGELLLRRHSGELMHIAWGSIEYPTG